MFPGVHYGKCVLSLFLVKPSDFCQTKIVLALLAVLMFFFCLFYYLKATCMCPGSQRFCYLAIIGGGVSPDVWPELSDAPGGLTDSRGAVHGASPPTFQKAALPSSKPNKPSPPSSPHSLGQTEVSKVSETVQEELPPSPQKAAPKGQSKSDPQKKKKDVVGEN